MKPLEVEILVAELGDDGENQLYHIAYEGTITDEDRFAVLGGDAETITERVGGGLAGRLGPGRGRQGGHGGAGRARPHPGGRRPRSGHPEPGERPPHLPRGSRKRSWHNCWHSRQYGWPGGTAHLRDRERVRGDLHPARPAPAQPRRGGALPVPPRGVVGPLVQRLPRERRPPLPRRRAATPSTPRPSATASATSSCTTRRGSGSWPSWSPAPRPACARRASGARSTCSRTTPTRSATPTAATRTT